MDENSSSDRKLVEGLGRLLGAIEASGRAVLPSSSLELLQSIVEAAARIFGAGAASISLVDESEHELEFKVATGVGKEDVVGMRIPLDKGIAGYVAMTGQAIAIADVKTDPRFLLEFAESTGYVPSSILATPLLMGDQVIGVMEVLDKIDAPSFGMQDMELLGVFAHQAAIAISQSQQYDLLDEALIQGIKQLLASDPEFQSDEIVHELEGAGEVEESRKSDLMELAAAFHAISAMGEAERKMCIQIMSVLGEYVRSRPRFV